MKIISEETTFDDAINVQCNYKSRLSLYQLGVVHIWRHAHCSIIWTFASLATPLIAKHCHHKIFVSLLKKIATFIYRRPLTRIIPFFLLLILLNQSRTVYNFHPLEKIETFRYSVTDSLKGKWCLIRCFKSSILLRKTCFSWTSLKGLSTITKTNKFNNETRLRLFLETRFATFDSFNVQCLKTGK